MDRKVNYLKGKESWQDETHSLNIPARIAQEENTGNIDKLTDSIKFLSTDLGDAIQTGNSLSIPNRTPASAKKTTVKKVTPARESPAPEIKQPVYSSSFDIPGARKSKNTSDKTRELPKATVNEDKKSSVNSADADNSPIIHLDNDPFSIPVQRTVPHKSNPQSETARQTEVNKSPANHQTEDPYSIPIPAAAQRKSNPSDSQSKREQDHVSIPTTMSSIDEAALIEEEKNMGPAAQPVDESVKRRSFNDELNSIFHKSEKKKPKKPTYSERMAVGMKFYQHLLLVFLVTCLICGASLGYLWFWLSRYEDRSINGAVRNYLKEISAENWDSIYEEDTTYFIELNSKEKYIAWLQEKYKGLTISTLTYSFTSADDLSQYYTVYDEYGNRITSLELRKPDDSKTWKVRTLDSTVYYNFDVLDNTGFMINSISIDSSYANEADQIPYAFENLGLDEKMPSVTRYSIKNFVDDPDITLSDSNKSTAVRDRSANQYYIGPAATDEQYTEFSTEIEETTTAYCQYISKDGTFTALNKHLYPNTDFYNNIVGFNNQWYSSHDTNEFQNTRIYDVMPIGDNAFIGSISFDYVVTASDVTRITSSTYQLFFVKNSADEWKLVNLIIVASEGSGDTITATPTATPEG